MASLKITSGHASAAGIKATNDDAVGIMVPDEPLLSSKGLAAVIADGMSTAIAGREASHICVHNFLSDYFATSETWAVKKSAHTILTALNRWLHGQGHSIYGTSHGLVSTLSAVIIKSSSAHVFHIGDTRIYLYRAGELECLTRDHRTRFSKEKEFLSRAMGIELSIEVDYQVVTVEEGDLFYLCSDGVHEFVNDSQLIEQINNETDLNTLSQNINQLALSNGSDDNVSCLFFRIEELPGADEAAFYRSLTTLPFPPPLSPGMSLDGYRVVREIHASKRSQVYLVTDEASDENYVMKTPSPNFDDDPLYIDLFLHEEWIGRRVNNPHVMTVFEPKRRRQALYTITEYIEGETLREWMDKNPNPSMYTVNGIVDQLIKGLRVFQRMEMIHQDLKPDNIMIDRFGTLKIIDFGSTKVAGLAEISSPIDKEALLGTEDYTAPEYMVGQRTSFRSDIYSLGTIIYEMLCGKLPYGEALTPRNIKRAEYHPIQHYNSKVPAWIDGAIAKAVLKDPARRYQNLSELQQDLSRPNKKFRKKNSAPLIESNPLLFWRVATLIFVALNIVQLLF